MTMFKSRIGNIAWAGFAVMLYILVINIFKLPEPFAWISRLIILFIFYKGVKKITQKKNIDSIGYYLTILFIVWLTIGFIRGCFYTTGYWMWKASINNFINTLFFITIFLATNPIWVQQLYKYFWKYVGLLLIIGIVFFHNPNALSYLPYSTLFIFAAIAPSKKKWLLLAIIFLFFITQEQRNDLAKIAVAIIIGLTFYLFKRHVPLKVLKIVHSFLLLAPFLLLYFGINGSFNIFNMNEYIKSDIKRNTQNEQGMTYEDDLKADTRTFIYRNVFYTMEKYDAWILGRSTAFGDEGPDRIIEESYDITKLKGRYGNEVQILNLLLWYGIISIVLYFLIYARASYLAIYKSNSIYMKAIGIYTAFLWLWAFIWEVSSFETYFLMNIIFLGICFSKQFLNMKDKDFECWTNYIFKKR